MENGVAIWWDAIKVVLLLVGMAILGRYTPTILEKFSLSRQQQQRRMRLLETLHLGSERTVHLVEVDGVKLVLGASRTGVNLLTQLAGEVTESADTAEQLQLAPDQVVTNQAVRNQSLTASTASPVVTFSQLVSAANTATAQLISTQGANLVKGMRNIAARISLTLQSWYAESKKAFDSWFGATRQYMQSSHAGNKHPIRPVQGPVRRGRAGKGAAKSSRKSA